jgi:hypothetical protein
MDDGRRGFGQRTVATHHRDGPHTASVSPPAPLLHLQPSGAFRLTPGATWSTDTASKMPMAGVRVEASARAPPRRSHGRAGGRTYALPELWL